MKKILLSTIHRPLGVESENCTVNIQAEMYHAQVTKAQGIFSIKSVCNGWGLDFIAVNLKNPVTVLHYPTERVFIRELKKGYDYIGINFVICTYPKAVELCRIIRKISPMSKIVLGGYGTVLKECDNYADYVCREEGVRFFKRILGDNFIDEYKSPVIERKLKVMSVTTRPEAIIATGLGCSRGCDFCCTSHFYKNKYIPLLKTGREIHDAMVSVDFGKDSLRNIGIIDEDFLIDKGRINELIELNSKEIEKPIFFSCLTSLKSIEQYTDNELLDMGLSGVWAGIESLKADYPKLKQTDAGLIIRRLKNLGIIPLTSMIIGFDWHDEKSIEEDFNYLISLSPAFSQFMIYSPCPNTPLYSRFEREDRLLNVPHKYHDGFHALFRHPHLSSERLQKLIEELFRREYEELGPSIFRVLEVQLNGYHYLKESYNPLYLRRAEEYKKLCFDIYPLFDSAIKRAPTLKVRNYLKELKINSEESLKIPLKNKLQKIAVPALIIFNKIKDNMIPNTQPRVTINRYNY